MTTVRSIHGSRDYFQAYFEYDKVSETGVHNDNIQSIAIQTDADVTVYDGLLRIR